MRLHTPEGRRRRQPDDELHRRWTRRAGRLDEGTPDGAQLLRVGEGRERQVQARVRSVRKAVPVLPGRPHLDTEEPRGNRLAGGGCTKRVEGRGWGDRRVRSRRSCISWLTAQRTPRTGTFE